MTKRYTLAASMISGSAVRPSASEPGNPTVSDTIDAAPSRRRERRGRDAGEGVVDEEDLGGHADRRRGREQVEDREVGEVPGVDDGPCGVPENEHTTRAGRRPVFARQSVRDGTGNWGLPHPAPCEPGFHIQV